MLRILAAAFALSAQAAFAQGTTRVDGVFDALGLGELIGIMQQEGLSYGADLENDLFPGRGGALWKAAVEQIYSTDRIEAGVREGLDSGLSDRDIAGILEFFSSETGKRIVSLEVAARRAMLDDAVEETASESWAALQAEDGPRWKMLEDFAEANDLIDSNVAGAMTSNYAFYRGLADGNAFEFEMTEEQILSDVWTQEPEIRSETVDWVYSFTALAYQPLSDEDFRAYIDFARTPAGQALNAALFESFNEVFADISRDLGRGAARYLAGQDI